MKINGTQILYAFKAFEWAFQDQIIDIIHKEHGLLAPIEDLELNLEASTNAINEFFSMLSSPRLNFDLRKLKLRLKTCDQEENMELQASIFHLFAAKCDKLTKLYLEKVNRLEPHARQVMREFLHVVLD